MPGGQITNPMPPTTTAICCPSCDLRLKVPELRHSQRAACPRCGAVLATGRQGERSNGLAMTLTAMLLFLASLMLPILQFYAAGRHQPVYIVSGVMDMLRGGDVLLAMILLATLILVPALLLMMMLEQFLFWRDRSLWIERFGAWAMLDVYLLGIAVAAVKLGDMVAIDPQPGLFALVGSLLCGFRARMHLEPRPIERHAPKLMPESMMGRSWALVLTALLLLVVANVYPIFTIYRPSGSHPTRLFESVLELKDQGMWFVALVVFTASMVIPIGKLMGLGLLLVSAARGWRWSRLWQARVFTLIHRMGRWSMLDIYLLAILISVMKLSTAVGIHPGPGAPAFAGAVIITMFASYCFDPRWLWRKGNRDE